MLKQYKRLLYILGVVVVTLLHSTVFAQGTEPPKKEVNINYCKDAAMPVDLFQVLGIQISSSNGFWTDDNGRVVDNIFNPADYVAGTYNFTFHITTEVYCGAIVGNTFLVTVGLRESGMLNVEAVAVDAKCDFPNGSIIINSIQGGSDYKYMVAKKVSDTENTTVVDWTDLTWNNNPVTVANDLGNGEYYLHIVDKEAETQCSEEYVQTINVAMASSDIELNVIGTDVVVSGLVTERHLKAETKGGVEPYTYEWYLYDQETGIYNKIEGISPDAESIPITNGSKYQVKVTDALGCFDTKDYEEVIGETPKLLANYFFCQGNFIELTTGKLIDPRTVEQLLFATAANSELNNNWAGYTIKVFDDATTTTVLDRAWFVNAITNGSNVIMTKFVDVINPDGVTVMLRKEITLTIFNRPADLALKLSVNKYDWDINDKVRFETTPNNMKWYDYYLNDKFIDRIELTNIFDVDAILFTGTVQDMMKVNLGQSVTIPNVTDERTCTWTTTLPVTINIPFPNTFTPDGDGINDVFLGGDKFRGREFHLEILNRYGNRLYYGDKGWDGNYKGSPVAPGTYFYIVHIKVSDGTTKVLKGAVTLVRHER